MWLSSGWDVDRVRLTAYNCTPLSFSHVWPTEEYPGENTEALGHGEYESQYGPTHQSWAAISVRNGSLLVEATGFGGPVDYSTQPRLVEECIVSYCAGLQGYSQ